MSHKMLAGVHFTGSTGVFRNMWKTVGDNIANYLNYPRIVGETGGKDFIIAHPEADAQAVKIAMIRGSFEYQGQKCSASSRAYIPQSMWDEIKDDYAAEVSKIKVGDVKDLSNFLGAVIDKKSFDNIKGYIDRAAAEPGCSFVTGGTYDDSVGYFVQPTTILCEDPNWESMVEEIFGPVLSVYVFPDNEWEQTLELVDQTSEYALTGAIYSQDRYALEEAMTALENSAGNFYINDKPSGAVVGQQPFGGSRGSGTNDKAGSKLNLLRWVSPRLIKENFNPPTSYPYPYME